MPDHRSDDKAGFYKCGRCNGNIRFLLADGRPKVCPECGYGHGTRNVNDVPSEVRLSINNLNQEGDGSRGITEQSTISSR